jgi:hypothetical protein
MKRVLASSLFFVLFLIPVFSAHAEYVSGYTKANGTYVQGYERSAPDGIPYNNYDYPGNYNPNTDSITGGSAATYLENYYDSSYGSDYSYTSTPTCPLNSYYNGSSCSCSSGYVSSGGSCISGNTLCYAQLGYLSSYDSSSNQCECDTGDVIGSDGQCTSTALYCFDQMGLMSQYNSSTKTCGCMAGYTFNGSTCVYQSSSSYNDNSSCPINSHTSATDASQCTCDTGYQVNSTKDACVVKLSSTNDQLCQISYGLNSIWNGTTNSNSTINCSCKIGYNWNTGQTQCVFSY